MNIKNIIVAICAISVGLSNSTVIAFGTPHFPDFEQLALVLISGSVGATLGAQKGAELGRQYGQWIWPAGGAAVGVVAGGFAGAISGMMAYDVIINVNEKVRKKIAAMRKKNEPLREKSTK